MSLLRPSDICEAVDHRLGNVEKILAVPLVPAQGDRESVFAGFGRNIPAHGTWGLSRGLPPIFARIASLHPIVHAKSREAMRLIDRREEVASVGSLVWDPRGVFSNLLIDVDRSKFTLKLYGFRNGEKKLLYSARVGLGSAQYPTPRGSFYVSRIFDDHPLWIPPNRPWAWGQRPSRAVYGGHMMPFFRKRPISNRRILNLGPDIVAPPMKMYDAGMYRIHGTDTPWSVGSNQSHGCVRMLNRTVAKLANNLKIYAGTVGRGRSANGKYVDLARPVKLVLH